VVKVPQHWHQIKAWRNQLRIIYEDVVGLHHSRRVLRRAREIYRANAALQTDHFFIAWLTKNYAEATAVGIRRLTDDRRDVVSFWRLLLDLEKHATILTREWYVNESLRRAPANDLAWWRVHANAEFDLFGPNDALHASPALIRQDRDKLDTIARLARDFVNAKIAHRSVKDFDEAVTLTDLSDTLDHLGELLKRYHLLLEQAGLLTAEPEIPTDWEWVFRTAWLPDHHG
jgi:HEPN superfamily AbiU2-like protein